MNKLTEEQVEVAVNWWADRVCQPEFHTQTPGENVKSIAMAESMAYLLTKPVNFDSKEKFIDELRKRITSSEFNPFSGLHVDYHPDRILSDAAIESGVELSNFPWKTGMYFGEDGSVKAKIGYGSELETLLEGEKEND